MSGIIDPKTGQPIATPAGAPQAQKPPFVPPIDPNTGQPAINPSTGQPYTEDEVNRLQEEAKKTVELACQMLTRVIPDTLIVIGPGGIIHAVGDTFRLKKVCDLAAQVLDKRGDMMFRRMGWGRAMQAISQDAPPLTPEEQKKFAEDVQKALDAQMKAAQEQAEPPADATEEPTE